MCLKVVYCAIVRSLLEYCCVVWCPLAARSINRLESVQRKFTSYALRLLPWSNGVQPPYYQRCLLLGLETLNVRRKNMHRVFAFRLLKGELDSPALLAAVIFFCTV